MSIMSPLQMKSRGGSPGERKWLLRLRHWLKRMPCWLDFHRRTVCLLKLLWLWESNFIKLATVVALNAKSYQLLLLHAPKNGVAGGRTYDAVIGACAEQGKASTVLTFNAGDFTALGQDFDVVVPGTI
jgi:hypothetical protein